MPIIESIKLSKRMRKGAVQFSGNGKLFNEWVEEVVLLEAEIILYKGIADSARRVLAEAEAEIERLR